MEEDYSLGFSFSRRCSCFALSSLALRGKPDLRPMYFNISCVSNPLAFFIARKASSPSLVFGLAGLFISTFSPRCVNVSFGILQRVENFCEPMTEAVFHRGFVVND